MSTTSDQMNQLLARLKTVGDEELVSETRSPRAEALFARIVAEPRGRTVRRSSRPWLFAGGIAAAAAVAAIVIGIPPSPEAVTPAAAALRQAADVARAQEGVSPGQYLYVRSDNATLAFGAVPVDPSDVEGPTLECCEALVPH